MLTNAGPTIVVGTRTRGTRVSSSPSKIPYGEFSSVRLQTGFRPRPSPARSGSSLHPAPAYTRLKSRSRKRATGRSGTCVQAALSPSDRTLPSRGPWLASGFCCPAGSTLTMTSSETLGSSKPTYIFADRSYLSREVPQFTLPVCLLRAAFRTPADRATALGCSFVVRFGLPHPWSGSASACPRAPVPAWPSNEAAKFALCYGPEESLALHRPGRLRSSFHLLSRLKKASNITTRANGQFPRPDLHRQDKQPYGLRPRERAKNVETTPRSQGVGRLDDPTLQSSEKSIKSMPRSACSFPAPSMLEWFPRQAYGA